MRKILFSLIFSFLVFIPFAQASDLSGTATCPFTGVPMTFDSSGSSTCNNHSTQLYFSPGFVASWQGQICSDYYISLNGITRCISDYVSTAPPVEPVDKLIPPLDQSIFNAFTLQFIQWITVIVGILALISSTKFGINLIKKLFPNSY